MADLLSGASGFHNNNMIVAAEIQVEGYALP
jgi:hypothetical protein